MPLYEYECGACGRRFELIRKFSDPPVEVCTLCGSGPVTRLLSSPAIQFKGSGWYITDYAKKSDSAKSEGTKSDGTKSDGASSSGAGKPEGTSDKASAPAPSAPAPSAKTGGTAKD